MCSRARARYPHASDSPGNLISRTKEKHPQKDERRGEALSGTSSTGRRRAATLRPAVTSPPNNAELGYLQRGAGEPRGRQPGHRARATETAERGSRLTAARLRPALPAGRSPAKGARDAQSRRPATAESPHTLPLATASRSPLSPRALPPLRWPLSAPSRRPSAHRQPTAQRRLPPGGTRGEAAISRRRGRCRRGRPSPGPDFPPRRLSEGRLGAGRGLPHGVPTPQDLPGRAVPLLSAICERGGERRAGSSRFEAAACEHPAGRGAPKLSASLILKQSRQGSACGCAAPPRYVYPFEILPWARRLGKLPTEFLHHSGASAPSLRPGIPAWKRTVKKRPTAPARQRFVPRFHPLLQIAATPVCPWSQRLIYKD